MDIVERLEQLERWGKTPSTFEARAACHEIERLRAELDKFKWQPIEDYPTPDKEVLLTDGHSVWSGYYSLDENHWGEIGYWPECYRGNHYAHHPDQVTSWSELPTPPQENTDD